MIADYPILEFDPTREAVLEPSRLIEARDVPKHAVICFFAEVIAEIIEKHDARIIHTSASEIGKHPLYEIAYQGQRLAFFHPGIGAPLAIGLMEEIIALGVENFIACGGCGVLDKEIAVGHLLLPIAAIRDEGTSYHYALPSREIEVDPAVVEIIEAVLSTHELQYIKTKTWTTDAIYRETPAKIRRYREEGCLSVEMETAAFIALAQFRNVRFGQLLYGGDAVLADAWDGRSWNSRNDIRQQLFWLAAEACLKL